MLGMPPRVLLHLLLWGVSHNPLEARLFWDDRAFPDALVHLANREWSPSTQYSGPSKPVILPLDCWELLRDARRFTESKQGWSQVTLTPKDQAAASQGK